MDDYFSDAILATNGEDAVIRFSTHALKQNSQLLLEAKLLPIAIIDEKNSLLSKRSETI